MGDSSLIRATLLIALLAAVGFVAAGRAPAAESSTKLAGSATASLRADHAPSDSLPLSGRFIGRALGGDG